MDDTRRAPSGGEAVAAELDRLRRDARELRALLQHLSHGQAALDSRLQRVENSVVFRFLKWLGPKLAAVGLPGTAGIPPSAPPHGVGQPVDRSYSNWVQETSLVQSLRAPVSAEPPAPGDTPRVSVILECRQPDREHLTHALASLESQQYSDWELLVLTAAEPPDWLAACVSKRTEGRFVATVGGESPRASLTSALGTCRGEFVAMVSADAILEPDALGRWLASAGSGAAAVYSDWDYIDASGRRHTPRFTPEFSSELLSHTLYWGGCYFARTAQLRLASGLEQSTLLPWEHELAIHLSQGAESSIVRVPRMLWHMQGEAAPESVDSAPFRAAPGLQPPYAKSVNGSQAGRGVASVDVSASIIVCSRNSDHLRKCLKALLPTLAGRHEVIVVAHQAGDGPVLEQVAASHAVRLVPYDGAFHFGVMNGLGVAASSGQALCFLNDDVYPIAGNWLDSMLAYAMRPNVGVVGALLLYPNGTIQHAGVAVGGWYLPAHVGRFRVESPYWPWLRMTREVTAVTGACMTLRRTVWDELGGFDPQYPVNYNDIDFCLRAGERGYRILLDAQAVLTHEESQTRIAVVRPEESELFYRRWSAVMSAPDPFFNPQLGHLDDSIQLPSPWTLAR